MRGHDRPGLWKLYGVFTFSLERGACLRLFEQGDAEELYEVVAANRPLLSRWMPWAAEQMLEDTAGFIQSAPALVAGSSEQK
jgi:hypothetical protein